MACELSVAGLVKREFRAGNGYWYGLSLSVITDSLQKKINLSVITDNFEKNIKTSVITDKIIKFS